MFTGVATGNGMQRAVGNAVAAGGGITAVAGGAGSTSTQVLGLIKGRYAYKFASPNAGLVSYAAGILPDMGFMPAITRDSAVVLPDDYAVTRLVCIGAFLPAGSGQDYVGDGGLQVVLGYGIARTLMGSAGQAPQNGWGFVNTAANQISFITRAVQNGPVTSNQVITGAGFDQSIWHAYELRHISATPTTDAQLKVYIDNVRVLTLSWGAGTVLPTSSVGTDGRANVIAQLAVSGLQTFYVNQLRFIQAPTEDATL